MQFTRLTCDLNSVGPITKAAQKQYKNITIKKKQKQYNNNKKTCNINKVLGKISKESVSKK